MATATKTKTDTKVIVTQLDEAKLAAAEAKAKRELAARPQLDAYLTSEDAADKASKRKSTNKTNLMAATEHGDVVVATDGRQRQIENQHVDTNQHAKVVGLLAATYKVSEKELAKLYKQTKGSKHVQEAKKI